MGLISRVSSRTYRDSKYIKPKIMGGLQKKSTKNKKPNVLKSLTKTKKSSDKPKNNNKKRPTAVEKARKHFLEKKSANDKKREQKNKEREEALVRAEKRREDKAKLNKALGKKSKKGQPMMNVRMSHLLNKIENNPDRYGMN